MPLLRAKGPPHASPARRPGWPGGRNGTMTRAEGPAENTTCPSALEDSTWHCSRAVGPREIQSHGFENAPNHFPSGSGCLGLLAWAAGRARCQTDAGGFVGGGGLHRLGPELCLQSTQSIASPCLPNGAATVPYAQGFDQTALGFAGVYGMCPSGSDPFVGAQSHREVKCARTRGQSRGPSGIGSSGRAVRRGGKGHADLKMKKPRSSAGPGQG